MSYIPKQIRPYIDEVKNSVKYIRGNKIVFDSSESCHKFIGKLYEDEYNGIIDQPFDYSILANSRHIVKFTKVKKDSH